MGASSVAVAAFVFDGGFAWAVSVEADVDIHSARGRPEGVYFIQAYSRKSNFIRFLVRSVHWGFPSMSLRNFSWNVKFWRVVFAFSLRS